MCKLFYSFLLILLPFCFYAQEDVIIRIRTELISLPITEDFSRSEYPLKDILNDRGQKLLKSALATGEAEGVFDAQTVVKKAFGTLSWKDSLTVTRYGKVIGVPPFWATFAMPVVDINTALKVIRFFSVHNELANFAEIGPKVIPQSYPNDSLFERQYSLVYNPSIPYAGIDVENAWDIETGKPFVKIAVLDNGIDTTHEDLDVLFGGGYHPFLDSITGLPYWGRPVGYIHGTPVAGIIAARRNNEVGIAGIAGGDGSDTSGISLIDLTTGFLASVPYYYLLAATVDAARSVGTYWTYESGFQDEYGNPIDYFTHAPGFGVHAQNHSYIMYADIPVHIDGKDIGDPVLEDLGNCRMCREAFLFSLKCGVINVVARGNSSVVIDPPGPTPPDLTMEEGLYPQSFPDNWAISVGASGYDGTTISYGVNQGYWDSIYEFESLYGGNMDLIAPGSDSIVYSTYTYNADYRWFAGTSAAAPHVTGVVGLLLSHYDRNCYVNQNLTIEDIEYILEHSASDVLESGYDEMSAYGRLNANDALKMMELPYEQFIHTTNLVDTQLVSRDTIALHYNYAYDDDYWGPLSTNFEPVNDKYYQVERLHYRATYDFSDYITPSTVINAIYPLQSRSNALRFHEDTVDIPLPGWSYDEFDVNPYNAIYMIDSTGIVVTEGYYYHFIATYEGQNNFTVDIDMPIDFWYPINPEYGVSLPVTIYLRDDNLLEMYDQSIPCDSVNIPYDIYVNIKENPLEELVLYPNPSKGIFDLIIPHSSGVHAIRIIDLFGQIVYSAEIPGKKHSMDLTFLPAGTFIVQVKTGNQVLHTKLIKL